MSKFHFLMSYAAIHLQIFFLVVLKTELNSDLNILHMLPVKFTRIHLFFVYRIKLYSDEPTLAIKVLKASIFISCRT